mmetsp:Transcript_28581/g.98696  ORF Transcript_28581/g.98696 Transcript_28581/m.98696 type:complete len:250 (+) Transcript_28581:677-1426(+)
MRYSASRRLLAKRKTRGSDEAVAPSPASCAASTASTSASRAATSASTSSPAFAGAARASTPPTSALVGESAPLVGEPPAPPAPSAPSSPERRLTRRPEEPGSSVANSALLAEYAPHPIAFFALTRTENLVAGGKPEIVHDVLLPGMLLPAVSQNGENLRPYCSSYACSGAAPGIVLPGAHSTASAFCDARVSTGAVGACGGPIAPLIRASHVSLLATCSGVLPSPAGFRALAPMPSSHSSNCALSLSAA